MLMGITLVIATCEFLAKKIIMIFIQLSITNKMLVGYGDEKRNFCCKLSGLWWEKFDKWINLTIMVASIDRGSSKKAGTVWVLYTCKY